jgi:hypothetical protein
MSIDAGYIKLQMSIDAAYIMYYRLLRTDEIKRADDTVRSFYLNMNMQENDQA